MRRLTQIADRRAALTLAACLSLSGCSLFGAEGGAGETGRRPALAPVAFTELPQWNADGHADALAALKRSCPRIATGEGTKVATASGEVRTPADEWKRVCAAANAVGPRDNRAAKAYFEKHFQAYAVSGTGVDGKFTGYYEPEIRGSRAPSRRFTIPVYRKPPDVKGEQAYLTRTEIENGALKGRGLEVAYVEDGIGLFEMQVQGSGRIALAEGGVMRLGFDGTNNRPYTAIGKVLVDEGALKREEATWPGIRRWLQQNPARAREIMRKNERYVFFRDTGKAGATGAQGVALTSGRSMAVDPNFVGYGVPIYIDTERPAPGKPGNEPFRRLMVAQDTGAAIKGPVRGDVFFGTGSSAADSAGRMNSAGRWWILLPKKS